MTGGICCSSRYQISGDGKGETSIHAYFLYPKSGRNWLRTPTCCFGWGILGTMHPCTGDTWGWGPLKARGAPRHLSQKNSGKMGL